MKLKNFTGKKPTRALKRCPIVMIFDFASKINLTTFWVKSLCWSLFLDNLMTTAKLVTSQKAVDQLKPEGSASSKWSIKLVLDALLSNHLIVSSTDSLNHIKLLLFDCIWIFGRLFSNEGKEEIFYIGAIFNIGFTIEAYDFLRISIHLP